MRINALAIVFLQILLFTALVAGCQTKPDYSAVDVNALHELTQKPEKNMIILDVRTAEEVEAGKIDGAITSDVLQTEQFAAFLAEQDKDKTYYVYCRSGGRSSRAVEQMKEAGFTNVHNVNGGFQAWTANGLPVDQ